MTSLGLVHRRLVAHMPALRIELVVLVLLLLTAAGAAFVALSPTEAAEQGDTVTAPLTAAKAADLVAATSAAPSQLRAVGQDARLINAALPFSSAPIQAARPFAISGADLDHRRALLCLTQAVYYEAGFEPLAGRRAVAQVVLNRMRHPAFPKSVCGVVYQGSSSPVCQFSFVCDGSLHRAPAAGAWRQAKEVAAAALAGHVERGVGSATHYHADYVAPRWAPMLTKITKLGAHIFYRWPGAWGQSGAFNGRYIGEPNDPASLRPGAPAPGTPEAAEQAIVLAEAGPPIARAENDVGGLLDVSKGWTLNIPDPREIASASTRALSQQRAAVAPPAAPAAAVVATTAPAAASR